MDRPNLPILRRRQWEEPLLEPEVVEPSAPPLEISELELEEEHCDDNVSVRSGDLALVVCNDVDDVIEQESHSNVPSTVVTTYQEIIEEKGEERVYSHPCVAENTPYSDWRDFGYVAVKRISLWWVLLWATLAFTCKLVLVCLDVGAWSTVFQMLVWAYSIMSFVYCMWWYAPTVVLAVRYQRVKMVDNVGFDVRPMSWRHAPIAAEPNVTLYRVTSALLYLGWSGWFRMWGLSGLTFRQIDAEFGGRWDVRRELANRRVRPIQAVVLVVWSLLFPGMGSFRAWDMFTSRRVTVSRTLLSSLVSERVIKCPERSIVENKAHRLVVSLNVDARHGYEADVVVHTVDMAFDLWTYMIARDGWKLNHHFGRGTELYW